MAERKKGGVETLSGRTVSLHLGWGLRASWAHPDVQERQEESWVRRILGVLKCGDEYSSEMRG